MGRQAFLCMVILLTSYGLPSSADHGGNGESSDCFVYSVRSGIYKYCPGGEKRSIYALGRNIIALDVDMKRECVFFTDARSDNSSIKRVCMGEGGKTRLIRQTNTLLEGVAWDWTTDNVYWLETKTLRLGVTSDDGNFTKVLYEGPEIFHKPRALVLHPEIGLLFWSDWSDTNPRVVRAPMDGDQTSPLSLVEGTQVLGWVNGIALDYTENRLYFTDARLDRISSVNIDGSDLRVVFDMARHYAGHPIHPYAIGLTPKSIYWSDWGRYAVLEAERNNASDIRTILTTDTTPLGFSMWAAKPAVFRPPQPTSCPHLWLLGFNASSGKAYGQCHCADGFRLSHDSDHVSCIAGGENSTKEEKTCPGDQFTCPNGTCIPSTRRCDGDRDCEDGSDEEDCEQQRCQQNEFACSDGPCIPSRWRCDSESDCKDGSDEEGCEQQRCQQNEFACSDGSCIPSIWRCDSASDCKDGSDEEGCGSSVLRFDDCLVYTSGRQIRKTCPYNHTNTVLGETENNFAMDVDVDYAHRCVYYADISGGNYSIKELCPNHDWVKVGTFAKQLPGLVEGIAYDWLGRNLYWLDNENREMVVTDRAGLYKAVIYRGEIFGLGRDLVLHPEKGILFWSDWSVEKPAIMRASMSGDYASVRVVVNGTETLQWPNGIALDAETEHLYWVDAKKHHIMRCRLDGTEMTKVRSLSFSSHPYGTVVSKKYIYWTDWRDHAIFATRKTIIGGQIHKIQSVQGNSRGLALVPRYVKVPTQPQTKCPQLRLRGYDEEKNLPFWTCRCSDGYLPSADNMTCEPWQNGTFTDSEQQGNISETTTQGNITQFTITDFEQQGNISETTTQGNITQFTNPMTTTLQTPTSTTKHSNPMSTTPETPTTTTKRPSFPFRALTIEGEDYTELTFTCRPLRLHRLCPVRCFIQVAVQKGRRCFKCVCQ